MSEGYGKGQHMIYDIQYYFVSVTKYRYHILKGNIAPASKRIDPPDMCVPQRYDFGGRVSKDHIHLHVSCPLELAPSNVLQYVKGRSSRLIPQEFPHLRKRYWGKHLWARGYFSASVGKLKKKMIGAYIEQQEKALPKDVLKVSDEV
jgi:putative transposase